VINLKIMKSGLGETLATAEMATKSGVGLMVGGMVETRLAMSFSLALALGVGGVTHFDLDTPLLMSRDPVRGGYAYDGPRMMMWNEPGIGAVPEM
jgi:L-alanine-DL-glutamate epimerase-like enolase superfamily enzyme